MAGTFSIAKIPVHRSVGITRIDYTAVSDGSGNGPVAATIGKFWGRLVGVLYNGGCSGAAVLALTDHLTGAIYGTFTTVAATKGLLRPTVVVNAATSTFGTGIAAAATATDVNRDLYVAGAVDAAVTAQGNTQTGIFSLIFDEGPGALAGKAA